MLYCEKCNVKISGQRGECPLCQNVLRQSDDADEEIYPVVPTTLNTYKLYFKILLFVTIVGVVSSIAVNILLPKTGAWSSFVSLGGIYIWVAVWVGIQKRQNIVKNIFYQSVMILIAAILLDLFFLHNNWSLNYILPCLCIGMMTAVTILAKVMNLPISQYVTYLILICLFSIIPSILIITGLVTVYYPSVICVGVSIISLSALFIFQGGNIIAELKRRLHL
ncbi:MAG: hypothetical protein GYA50_07175 [Eubacteriaceae bacterium]|nr:hypothetical protein [Eubacteriaceae bacterium]